jgi:23S rRNA (adenine2503-C2)-methyltransferase
MMGATGDIMAKVLPVHFRAFPPKPFRHGYNTVEGLEWERPALSHCRAFQDVLKNAGVTATLRIEKGHDIDAACGQLRLKQETAEGIV